MSTFILIWRRHSQEPTTASTNRVNNLLTRDCVLDLFVRQQLLTRDVIDFGRQMKKLQLAEPIQIEDEFDAWQFDYMRGICDLWLIPVDPVSEFPLKWKLSDEARIFYKVQTEAETPQKNDSSTAQCNVDRPSTVSLEQFVKDVCEKLNNGQAEKWICSLREEDITTYPHLANLKFSEWAEIKTLSVNAHLRKSSYGLNMSSNGVLFEAILSFELALFILDISQSELFACLHQIRLYFHHVLEDQFASSNVSNPAKLDSRCVDLTFREMRVEGFADDGLFDRMKTFFLPLTTVEQDLKISDTRWSAIAARRIAEKNRLEKERSKIVAEREIAEDQYYDFDERILKLTRNMEMKSDSQRLENFSERQIIDYRKECERLEPIRSKLQSRMSKIDDMLENINKILNEKARNSGGQDLIKPNRGFIMYGPPGTGKSDIMSNLSKRMGIAMVAPPLAAGELNRSLVGESERIINDICMRCHRIPYLMCCVSIDEIDSLAPKRTNDTSDGNVAKLSVLLSVIDGIKDVPNLMIFCATNRLHMMDDAFLRRMQGKFFVGRPSSQARKIILSGIKTWHMEPELLENLTMATTNFSGAALRALRRIITVHCVDVARTDPNWQIDYRTSLELANEIAQQYRVFIGSETLPTLLLRTLNDNQTALLGTLPDKRNSVYTGRIVINFSTRRIDVEAVISHSTAEQEKIVYHEDLTSHETDIQNLLERLTIYGKSRNVQLLQLIDLSLLSIESAYDEKRKFEILTERVDECNSYRRSMIVYDLDSLVGVNKSEGQSSTGSSTNISLTNQSVFTFVGDRFKKAHVDMARSDEEQALAKENWAVVVGRDPFLLRQFCDFIQFTRATHEVEEEENNRRRQEEKNKCFKCNDYYLEQDNKMGVCVHHDGFVYDNISAGLTKCSQRSAIQQLLTEEALSTNQPAQREHLERMKQRFKFICCNQTVGTAGNMGGCKRGCHGLEDNPTVTLVEWEQMCDENPEYLAQHLDLLNNRVKLQNKARKQYQ
ncbi:unnamed protein product [Adineta steineri]|uniref:AAA+ ATPase domain-containing protein n=1 Tax=Adineta steineri TaxID=433720 RepID=A0A819K6T3_9BILA|nr:unnamed protein product [Adineta steineri]